jgi:hypothetical protein
MHRVTAKSLLQKVSGRVFSVVLTTCVLFSCSSRDPRLSQIPQTNEPNRTSQVLGDFPRHTEEENLLAEYKHHYEWFKDHPPETYSSLSIEDEAKLFRDYANARDAFNDWLTFVTEKIEQQSQLILPDDPPKVGYRRRPHYHDYAEAALGAIRKLDEDLVELFHIERPSFLSLETNQPYDLGRRLRTEFDNLDEDNAWMAGTEMFKNFYWDKP